TFAITSTYNHILRTILAGNLIFADETQISYQDGSGYVWVIASMEETYYVFTETREGEFLIKLLKNFSGVLVSDFYAAYNSITCPQQKCLIHLIRDLNNDFFNINFGIINIICHQLIYLIFSIVKSLYRFFFSFFSLLNF
ncbi:MAG: transposase, partial [Cyanobacteria bacterium]|nr:transposase [Cyanobacteria bacterium CG_2015-09_32_10]